MGLREETVLDSLGCPTPANLTTTLSDNGSLYLSQYILLLHRRKEITKTDIEDYVSKLKQFLNFGNILRYPGDTSESCPDNMIMTKLKKFKDRWDLVSEDFNESELAAVKIFAVIFKELIKESNPAKFYNGRGQLLYAKYDLDFEEELKNLLDFQNYEKEC